MSPVSVFLRLKPPSRVSGICISKETDNTVHIEETSSFACDGVIDVREDMRKVVDHLDEHADTLVMSYGHSGSGKTHSMFGPGGMVEMVLARFGAACTCSFLEVYNEKVYDLLGGPHALSVCEDSRRNLVVKNLTSVRVNSPGELLTLVDIGMKVRVSGENGTHARSSRSHAIFQIRMQNRSIWLADLAGSEKFHQTSPETASIHKSLHALKRCIMAIKRRESHVPARSSVLTRLLFSRHLSQCFLVACVETTVDSLAESLSTLEFASTGSQLRQWSSPQPVHSEDLRQSVMELSEQLQEERRWREKIEKKLGFRAITPIPESPDSIMSSKWRQSKFDEILSRCWL